MQLLVRKKNGRCGKAVLFTLLSFLISGLGSSIVRAESSETLLNIYDMTLAGPDKLEIEEEMEEIQKDIKDAKTAKLFTDAENAFTDYQRSSNNTKIMSLNSELHQVLNDNNEVLESIKSDFENISISDLLSKDREYKKNISVANNMLHQIDFYSGVDYDYSEFDYDFEGMEALLNTKRVLYIEALDTYELGVVNGVKFPLDNERYVTSNYGNRIDPLNKTTTRFHAGTDYRAPNGTEVYSLFNGEVTSCGWSDTIGYFVVVEHGENVKTLYCHLSEIKVEKGQKVKQYDLIALSGGTGSRCTGPHLHLALYLNGATYNVDKLFK